LIPLLEQDIISDDNEVMQLKRNSDSGRDLICLPFDAGMLFKSRLFFYVSIYVEFVIKHNYYIYYQLRFDHEKN